jgi:hypothetical protein
MVNRETGALQIGAQLAELAGHATSCAVLTPIHSSPLKSWESMTEANEWR